jgi:hypothetical protein
MERWENHLDNRMVGANTRKRYAISIGRMFDQLDGKPLDQISGRLIADIVRGRRAEGASNATIRRDLVALSSIVNCAIAEGWLEANPPAYLGRAGQLAPRCHRLHRPHWQADDLDCRLDRPALAHKHASPFAARLASHPRFGPIGWP